MRNYDRTFPLNPCISLLFFLCNFYRCTFLLKRANRHVMFVRVLDMHIWVCWCFRALLHLSSLTFGCALFIFLSSEKNTFFPSEIPLWLLRLRGGDTSFRNGISVRIFPGLCSLAPPPPISSSPFCTALSFSQHGCYRRHWGLQWCPVSWKYPLSFLLPAVSWFIFNIPTSSSPPPPYVLHTYLWHLHTSLYFYLLFYFVPVRQWWKITFQQQILPLSLCTILQIRFFMCACTSDVTHTYMYIWPQLNNVNACEQKSFVWLVNSFRRGSFATGLGGLNGLRWCFILKGSFTQNGNSVIIYSPSCCSKPLWLTFFCRTQRKIFWWMLVIEHFRSIDQTKKNLQASLRIFFACMGAPHVHLILRKCLNQ